MRHLCNALSRDRSNSVRRLCCCEVVAIPCCTEHWKLRACGSCSPSEQILLACSTSRASWELQSCYRAMLTRARRQPSRVRKREAARSQHPLQTTWTPLAAVTPRALHHLTTRRPPAAAAAPLTAHLQVREAAKLMPWHTSAGHSIAGLLARMAVGPYEHTGHLRRSLK